MDWTKKRGGKMKYGPISPVISRRRGLTVGGVTGLGG